MKNKLAEKALTWGGIIVGGTILLWGIYEIFIKKKDVVTADLANLKSQGIVPTITETAAQGYADSLDTEIDSTLVSMTSILDIFNHCANLPDVLLIIQKYGTHFHFGFPYIGDFSLPQFIHERLNANQIAQINSLFQNKNINYTF